MARIMRSISVDGILHQAVIGLAGMDPTKDRRGGRPVREYPVPVLIALDAPSYCFCMNRKRLNNPFASFFETLWVMSGNNRIDWLSDYLPRASEFSDDGETWRGAYGQRLRFYGPDPSDIGVLSLSRRSKFLLSSFDQLNWAEGMLTDNPQSRRIVMNIYDPNHDSMQSDNLKDVPCNNWLNFNVRDGRYLDLHVAVRSQDIIWGLTGINIPEFSCILMAMAEWVGLTASTLYIYSTNLHLYDRHWARGDDIVAAHERQQHPRCTQGLPEYYWADSLMCFDYFAELVLTNDWRDNDPEGFRKAPGFYQDAFWARAAWVSLKDDNPEEAIEMVSNIKWPNLMASCEAYILRRQK